MFVGLGRLFHPCVTQPVPTFLSSSCGECDQLAPRSVTPLCQGTAGPCIPPDHSRGHSCTRGPQTTQGGTALLFPQGKLILRSPRVEGGHLGSWLGQGQPAAPWGAPSSPGGAGRGA